MIPERWLPITALLMSALVWGLAWYPFRALRDLGLPVATSTLACYVLALVFGLAFLYRRCKGRLHFNGWLVGLALAAGWTNFGYALGVTQGQVLRVMLLFFTAPLWTVVFSRLLLNERLNRVGAAVIALSFAGTVVMLWHPESGLPRLESAAEWYGLSAGMMFALTNVLVKKDETNTIEIKSIAVWLGVCIVSGAWLLVHPERVAISGGVAFLQCSGILVALALAIVAANLVVQYGIMRTPANRAVVIMVFELVVAALSAWLIDGERIDRGEWIGGLMIIGASLFSSRISRQPTA